MIAELMREYLMITLYNTLSRKKEVFEPLQDGKVGMYTCGPTVHDYQHIGNFRTMILSDIVRRVMALNGYTIMAVRNITDIDDKIIQKAQEKNLSIEDFSREYERIFFEDCAKLNILPVDKSTRATEFIPEMVSFIEDLCTRGLAYTEADGSVYFDISAFPSYGKLSGIEKKDLKSGTRVLSDEYTKDNVQDFALWKATGPDEVGYPSPWGRGRPGWHIECSVMSQSCLGDTFDIHVGGVDLLFPHHENEIAQSEGRTGKQFVKYFVHGEFVLIDSQKMAKSLKNFYTLQDIIEKGFNPLTYRFFTFSAHYRQQLHFTWDALTAAAEGYERLCSAVLDIKERTGDSAMNVGTPIQSFISSANTAFRAAINDDFNMPQALGVLFGFLKDVRKETGLSEDEYTAIYREILACDTVLGLGLANIVSLVIPADIQALVTAREQARTDRQWDEADTLRTQIEEQGYVLDDTPDGPKLSRRS